MPSASDWSDFDQQIAQAFRLERLRSVFPDLLAPCFLYLDHEQQLQIHIQQPSVVDLMLDSLDELGWYVWMMVGATDLSVWFCQEELMSCPTHAQVKGERLIEDGIQSVKPLIVKEPSAMSRTLAPTRPVNTASSPVMPASTSTPTLDLKPTVGRVQVRSLAAVAVAAKTTADRIEWLCHERGFPVLEDLDEQPAMLMDDATMLVKDLLTENAMAALQKPATTQQLAVRGTLANAKSNGTATATALAAPKTTPPATAKTAKAKPAAAAIAPPPRKQRSRERTISLPETFRFQRSLAETVENALQHFAETPGRRIVIARAIGNETVDGTKYLKAMLANVDPAKRQQFEIKLIKQFAAFAKAHSSTST